MKSDSLTKSKELQNIYFYLNQENNLTEILENEIIAAFDSRGEKAIKTLKENRLHRLILSDTLELWEVEGTKKSYLIMDSNFCECTDFYIRVLSRRKNNLCYHLLAKVIGEKLNRFVSRHISNEEYMELLHTRFNKKGR